MSVVGLLSALAESCNVDDAMTSMSAKRELKTTSSSSGRFCPGACWEFIASIMVTDIMNVCKAKATLECLNLEEYLGFFLL